MVYDQLKVGAILSYVGLAINILVGLFFTPWMIASIGRADYGLYTLALSVITLFVFDFGIGQAVTRYVANYLALGNQEKANNCLGLVYKLYLYIDIAIILLLVCLYFFIPLIYKELTPAEIEKFNIIYIAVATFSVVSFPFIPVNGILTANEKFIQLKLCDLVHKIILVIFMTICLSLGYGLYALVMANIISGLLTILLKLFFIKRDTKTCVNFLYKNRLEFREILNFSGWVTIKALAGRMIFTLSPSIIAMASGSTEVALFGIASIIEGYVFSFASALSGLFLPRVSRINSQADGDIMPLMTKIGRILLFIICLLIIGFVAVGDTFLSVWLGDGFEGLYWSVLLIIIPSIIYIPHEIGFSLIDVKNKVKYQAQVFVIMGVFNVICGYILTSMYGCLGMCLSIFISYNIRNVGIDYILVKHLNLDIRCFFKEVFISNSLYLIVILLFAIGINLLPMQGWIGFLIKSAIIVILYSSVLYNLVLNSYERKLLSSIINVFRL